jgi:hypothetical protein
MALRSTGSHRLSMCSLAGELNPAAGWPKRPRSRLRAKNGSTDIGLMGAAHDGASALRGIGAQRGYPHGDPTYYPYTGVGRRNAMSRSYRGILMKITERHALRDATEQDIMLLEERIGGSLPNDYKAFLRENNGGEPEPSFCQNTCVDAFYSLDRADPWYPIWEALFDYDGRIPPETLPIACDPFGNLILLGFAGEQSDKVFFWDHELENEDDLASNLTLEAETFTKFVESLDPLPAG